MGSGIHIDLLCCAMNGERSRALKHVKEDDRRHDGHPAVVCSVEVLIASNEILWRGMRRHEIEEDPITFISDR